MNVHKINNKVWEIKLDDYINVTNYFITTGDMLAKLNRLEKDLYKMIQDIYSLQEYFKKIVEEDKINYLETFIEDGKFYIKAKKSRARRVVMKEEYEKKGTHRRRKA